MKGLIVSTLVFVLYVVMTAFFSHFLRPDRHSKIFLPGILFSILLYFGIYIRSSADLGFIPPAWIAHYSRLDFLLGFVILMLNIHSYIDWFFGFNGGFSTSLILLLHRAGNNGMQVEEVIARYHGEGGMDKIYGWRLPRLEQTGYIKIDEASGICTLTLKGRLAAATTRRIKRALNLGAGG